MIEKVARLERLARGGYRLQGVDHLADGGIVVCVRRGERRLRLRFEHFEVPAVLQLTQPSRFAS